MLALERSKMEAEDFRGQIMRALEQEKSQAERSEQVFYKNWLKPGATVDLKPFAKEMLNLGSENFLLVKRDERTGDWRLEAKSGPYKGKHLWIDLPEECFC